MTARTGDTLPVAEITILWLTAGLGCDGDTIAVTAATQPSLEDLLGGALPWTPRVKLYNPFLATEVGDEFVRYFHRDLPLHPRSPRVARAARHRVRRIRRRARPGRAGAHADAHGGERTVPVLVEDGRVVQVGWQGRGCTVGG